MHFHLSTTAALLAVLALASTAVAAAAGNTPTP
ncbi:unnamed protein product, partial [Tilletia laevis]